LYVGGIPAGVAEQALVDHFNAQMMAANLLAAPGPPVISAQINVERGFAFLEFRSTEETTNCLAFDGMIVQGNALKIKRPKDYMPPVGEPEPVCGLSPFFSSRVFFSFGSHHTYICPRPAGCSDRPCSRSHFVPRAQWAKQNFHRRIAAIPQRGADC
jgi:RNA recognition motif-containing protein